jgi:hypothetical protein
LYNLIWNKYICLANGATRSSRLWMKCSQADEI